LMPPELATDVEILDPKILLGVLSAQSQTP
jgi:hypothetical protein